MNIRWLRSKNNKYIYALQPSTGQPATIISFVGDNIFDATDMITKLYPSHIVQGYEVYVGKTKINSEESVDAEYLQDLLRTSVPYEVTEKSKVVDVGN